MGLTAGGLWLFFRSLSPTDVVLGATTDSFRLPRSWFRSYLTTMDLDPNSPTALGATLFQFTLNGYYDQEPESQKAVLDVLALLAKRGADLNGAYGLTGLRPLHDAVLNGSDSMVKFLLDLGAAPELPAASGPYAGLTPLSFARSLGGRGGHDRTAMIAILEAETPPSP